MADAGDADHQDPKMAGAAADDNDDEEAGEEPFSSEDPQDRLGPLRSIASTSSRALSSVTRPLSQSMALPSGRSVDRDGSGGLRLSDVSEGSEQQSENSFIRASRSASLPPQMMSKKNESHLALLVRARQQSTRKLKSQMGSDAKMLVGFDSLATIPGDEEETRDMHEDEKSNLLQESEFLEKSLATAKAVGPYIPEGGLQRSIDIRLEDFSYTRPVNQGQQRIQTVGNLGCIFKLYKSTREIRQAGSLEAAQAAKKKGRTSYHVLKDINLSLKAGKMYLVLGPPGSGKTSLLRAIASLLPHVKCEDENPDPTKEATMSGSITYNGLSINNPEGVILSNTIAFVDQIDRHAPRLTVKETFNFSYQCKGGTHFLPGMIESPGLKEVIAKLDAENHRVNMNLIGLGLDHVADTFVGNDNVRGVSGGQRRRVTVGEMMTYQAPVLCGDEISTGLDAASTYDIVNSLQRLAKTFSTLRVFSLLQPSPETFALFDEVVLLSEGMIIYAGPILDAVKYFRMLGFERPDTMDDADFLQAVATAEDSALYYKGPNACPTPKDLADSFAASEWGDRIQNDLESPLTHDWSKGNCDVKVPDEEEGGAAEPKSSPSGAKSMVGCEGFKKQYANSFGRSLFLNIKRQFTIWKRDIRFIRANAIKNVIMGISVGGVFYQTTNTASIFGVLFQGMLFIMLGAMTSAPGQLDDRPIFYRHSDANFYPTASYVFGLIIALMPQTLMDTFTFATILYFMVGLANTAANFFIFIAILLTFTVVMNQLLAAVGTISPTKSVLQGFSSVILLFLMLFCGFIITPDNIPNYYGWVYWWNPLAWAYRALLLNEFLSSRWSFTFDGDTSGMTAGQQVLRVNGFVLPNGQVFGKEWILWGFIYMIGFLIIHILFSGLGLRRVRFESGQSTSPQGGGDANAVEKGDGPEEEEEELDLPFTPVELTFKDLCYEVTASTGNDKLMLLNNVYGRFEPGRMCALMGSSGAGKTTLMDVIALRKTSGTITGEVSLNGFPQEEDSFRRCSGYVYQFDQQTPQLTVRETILYSAKLRLDSSVPDSTKEKFVDQVMRMLELTSLANTLVGDDESGGLSFEQGKRLSIAVELAASPSVLFLDEPTSGLDSRAALIVMKSLKRIADSGRTICATIHQPSSSVFEMFDDLLLLKKGGRVVYHGPTGRSSCNLIDYFTSHGAAPINRGENPGTWMLTVITDPSTVDDEGNPVDYNEVWTQSDSYQALIDKIENAESNADESKKVTFESKYACPKRVRQRIVNDKLVLVYWRSPTYNRTRLIVSLFIAFLLASVFLTNRRPAVSSEAGMKSLFSTIFISFIIIGVMSITTVLPVMLKIRDVFYLHRAAGMIDHRDLNQALAVAEKRFICLGSACFCAVFYFAIGLEVSFNKFLAFWGFFTFNLALYSYFGQAFMCSVRGMATAQILNAVFIGINNFFSGLIVRPQYLSAFFFVPYYITPGHYVYEGLIVSQFTGDDRLVVANDLSEYQRWITALPAEERPYCPPVESCEDTQYCCPTDCCGTVEQYMDSFFGGYFNSGNLLQDVLVLGLFLVTARVLTYFSLRFFNYVST